MITRRHILTSMATGLACGVAGIVPSSAATAAVKSARVLVGFPPGGSTDVIARLLVGAMKDYASNILIENRPGGGSRFAIEALKTSPHDGSVFLLAPTATMTLYPHVHKSLRYDPLEDFIPVTTVGEGSYLLTIGSRVPAEVKTLADFVAWCRAHPEQASYASPGTGSPLHFTGVQFARTAGIDYLHVPYQGAAPALQDLLGGQVTSGILPIDTPLPYIKSGTLRALATSRPKRSALLPEVPTFSEAGYPALESVDWWGVFMPARTPDEHVEALANSIRDAVRTGEVREGLAKLSVEIDVISLGDFARLLRSEFARWRSVVATSGFSPQD